MHNTCIFIYEKYYIAPECIPFDTYKNTSHLRLMDLKIWIYMG